MNHLFLRTPAQSSVHFFCFNSLIVSTLHHVHNVRARLSRHTQDATSAYKILTAFPRMILSTIWPLLRDSICFPDLHTEFINIETTSFFLFFFYCFSFFLSFQIFSCHICYFFLQNTMFLKYVHYDLTQSSAFQLNESFGYKSYQLQNYCLTVFLFCWLLLLTNTPRTNV